MKYIRLILFIPAAVIAFLLSNIFNFRYLYEWDLINLFLISSIITYLFLIFVIYVYPFEKKLPSLIITTILYASMYALISYLYYDFNNEFEVSVNEGQILIGVVSGNIVGIIYTWKEVYFNKKNPFMSLINGFKMIFRNYLIRFYKNEIKEAYIAFYEIKEIIRGKSLEAASVWPIISDNIERILILEPKTFISTIEKDKRSPRELVYLWCLNNAHKELQYCDNMSFQSSYVKIAIKILSNELNNISKTNI